MPGGQLCREAGMEKPRSVTNYLSKTDASGSWLQMGGEVDAPRSSEVRPPGFEGNLFCLAIKLPNAEYFAIFRGVFSCSFHLAGGACPT